MPSSRGNGASKPPSKKPLKLLRTAKKRVILASELGMTGTFRDGPDHPKPKGGMQETASSQQQLGTTPAEAGTVTFRKVRHDKDKSAKQRHNAVNNPASTTSAAPVAAEAGKKRTSDDQTAVKHPDNSTSAAPVAAKAVKKRKRDDQTAIKDPEAPATKKPAVQVEQVTIDVSDSNSAVGDTPPPTRQRSMTRVLGSPFDIGEGSDWMDTDSDSDIAAPNDTDIAAPNDTDIAAPNDTEEIAVNEDNAPETHAYEAASQSGGQSPTSQIRELEVVRVKPVRGPPRQTSCISCLEDWHVELETFPMCHRNDAISADGLPASQRCFRCEKEDLECDDASPSTMQAAQDVVDQSCNGTDTASWRKAHYVLQNRIQMDMNKTNGDRLAHNVTSMMQAALPVAPVVTGTGTAPPVAPVEIGTGTAPPVAPVVTGTGTAGSDVDRRTDVQPIVHVPDDASALINGSLIQLSTVLQKFCVHQYRTLRSNAESNTRVADSYESIAKTDKDISNALQNMATATKATVQNSGAIADKVCELKTSVQNVSQSISNKLHPIPPAVTAVGIQVRSLAAKISDGFKAVEESSKKSHDQLGDLNRNMEGIAEGLGALRKTITESNVHRQSIAASLTKLIEIELSKKLSREKKAGSGKKH